MSKKYKGWEIAKLINEGKLNTGDLLKSNISCRTIKIVSQHLEFKENEEDYRKELGSSFLTGHEIEYEIIQKPVSFMEVVNSGKKCRVEHELVNREVLNGSTMLLAPEAEEMKNGEYIDLNWVLYFLGYSIDADNVKRVIKEGKWYIEESEEE